MTESLLVFRKYTDREQALRTAGLLRSHSIPTELEDQPRLLDSNFIGQQFSEPYVVKIPGASFEAANQLLAEQAAADIADADEDYILFSLSDEELKEVVRHKDEWGLYNYKLALQILAERNGSSAAEEEQLALKHVLPVIETPKSTNSFWIVICYLGLALTIAQLALRAQWALFLLPQLFFLLFGYTLYTSKTTLDNGARTYSYNSSTRMHGLIILIIAALLLLILLGAALRLLPLEN